MLWQRGKERFSVKSQISKYFRLCGSLIYVAIFFKNSHPRTCLLIFLERGEGRKRGTEILMWERNIKWMPLLCSPTENQTATWICSLTWNWTLQFTGGHSNQLSNTCQGYLATIEFCPHKLKTSHTQHVNEWIWLSPNKTLFTKTGSGTRFG